MLQYIQSPEFQQLLADNPTILVAIAGWLTFTLVASLFCLSRWFSITITHNHYSAPTAAQNRRYIDPLRPRKVHIPNDPLVFNEWLKRNFPEAAVKSPENEPVVGEKLRNKMAASKRFAILRRDGFRCRLCGLKATDDENLVLHVDHRLPCAEGGTDDDDNLWTLCESCNLGKSDLVVPELLPESDFDEAI